MTEEQLKLARQFCAAVGKMFAIRSDAHKIGEPDDVGAPTGSEHNTL